MPAWPNDHDRGTTMNKSRLEAFSDGVLAIIITIMVLELKTPEGSALADLRPLLPKFLSYVLSFVYVGIYWSNHHHLLQAASRVDGRILWANLNLMFWLSLLPLTTAWVGDHPFAAWPSAVYGAALLMAALAWVVLQNQIIRAQGPDSFLRRALGADLKGRVSPVLYIAGIGSSFFVAGLAQAFYAATALLWLVPDRRIERALDGKGE
jgi:uncharacterized membrane protein